MLATKTKHRILLIDDHPIVREGLRQCLDQEEDLEVCGQLEDGREIVSAISTNHPDLVIIDISLKESNGLSLTRKIKSHFPELPCLVLSMHDETIYAERALRAGAQGYIMKQEPAETLLKAIRKVLGGDIYLSSKMSEIVVNRLVNSGRPSSKSGVEGLSNRELEVFQLIGDGRSTREIADRLNVSIKTIETHRARIKDKIGVKTSNELVHYAVNWGQSTP